MIDLGWCDEGKSFTVAVTATQALDGFVYAAFLDEAGLESGITQLGHNLAQFTAYSDTCVTCEVEAGENELLFTSIPYEKGWRATVNGKAAEIVPIGGGLVGVPLTVGSNTVELHYTVRGLTAGMTISLLSIALAVWLLFGKEIATYLRSKRKSAIF